MDRGEPAPRPPAHGKQPPGSGRPPTPVPSGQRVGPSSVFAARNWRFWVQLLIVLGVNWWLVARVWPAHPKQLEIPYTVFREQVEAGNVAEVVSRGDVLQGTLKHALTYPPEPGPGAQQHTQTGFSTTLPSFVERDLDALLRREGVVINARPLAEPRAAWLNLLMAFGPTLVIVGGMVWLSRRAAQQMGVGAGGPFDLGRSRARRYDQPAAGTAGPPDGAAAGGSPSNAAARITFADVAGIDEVEAELAEVVDYLRHPDRYARLGGIAPKGVLLVGAPGTGKTLLAKAVAGEAGVPFFSMSASEFVEMIVGVGAARVRDLFKDAREAAPAIVFIDELDAIGRARGGVAFSGANQEQEQTLNQILTEMDGFGPRGGVIVLAATNRPDVLDPALLRPGRFDRRVVVHPPDRAGREAILRVHTRGVPLAPDVDLKQLAAATPGLVGADLRNLVNEAALRAARRSGLAVGQRDLTEALEKLVLGPERRVLLAPGERERVAYHEAGHALVGALLPHADPVDRVSITPRGQALGVTYQRPEDDRHTLGEEHLLARVTGAMGGRAAEEVVYGGRTTGGENDLETATHLARLMVTRWGMSQKVGPVALAGREHAFLAGAEGAFVAPRAFSESTARVIDEEVSRILCEAYDRAAALLRDRRAALDALAAALLERETLDGGEVRRIAGGALDSAVPATTRGARSRHRARCG